MLDELVKSHQKDGKVKSSSAVRGTKRAIPLRAGSPLGGRFFTPLSRVNADYFYFPFKSMGTMILTLA